MLACLGGGWGGAGGGGQQVGRREGRAGRAARRGTSGVEQQLLLGALRPPPPPRCAVRPAARALAEDDQPLAVGLESQRPRGLALGLGRAHAQEDAHTLCGTGGEVGRDVYVCDGVPRRAKRAVQGRGVPALPGAHPSAAPNAPSGRTSPAADAGRLPPFGLSVAAAALDSLFCAPVDLVGLAAREEAPEAAAEGGIATGGRCSWPLLLLGAVRWLGAHALVLVSWPGRAGGAAGGGGRACALQQRLERGCPGGPRP